jgi:hypothetical protein
MKLKTWHYATLIGGLGVLYVYFRRKNIKDYLNSNEFWRNLIAENAVKWVGVKEVGNNNGFANSQFQQMLQEAGWQNTEQWCMYFVKAVHMDTFKNEKDTIKSIFSGSTQQSFNNANNDQTGTYITLTSGRPNVGDIAIWQKTNDPSRGHAGVVIEVGDSTFTTIEGNTSDTNIADGDLVAKKVRPLAYGVPLPNSTLKLRGFIRKRNLI